MRLCVKTRVKSLAKRAFSLLHPRFFIRFSQTFSTVAALSPILTKLRNLFFAVPLVPFLFFYDVVVIVYWLCDASRCSLTRRILCSVARTWILFPLLSFLSFFFFAGYNETVLFKLCCTATM